MGKTIAALTMVSAFGGGAVSLLSKILGDHAEVAGVGLMGLGLIAASQVLSVRKYGHVTPDGSQGVKA